MPNVFCTGHDYTNKKMAKIKLIHQYNQIQTENNVIHEKIVSIKTKKSEMKFYL